MLLTSVNLPKLLKAASELLSQYDYKFLCKHQGAAFEPLLIDVLEQSCLSLSIQNIVSIELVSGHRFPDIVIHTTENKLGIEVKTSRGKGWATLGGSIFESTRVAEVDCIYVFFANFSRPEHTQFRFAPIDECISDVVITHKPRYAIDLDTQQTFFQKANVSYPQLQQAQNPFALIRKYMKQKAGGNIELWWVTDDESSDFELEQLGPQSIRHFSHLNKYDKTSIIDELYALFPEVLSTSTQKYEKLALYLVAKKGIVHTSLRDTFSAGGKYIFNGIEVPKYFKTITDNERLKNIADCLQQLPEDIINEYWQTQSSDNRLNVWLEKVSQQIQSNDKLCDNIRPQLITHITESVEMGIKQS